MKKINLGLVITLAAYTDTTMGIVLRSIMAGPIGQFDVGLMIDFIEYVHF